ncbi:MAG TPA: membrane protein insertase YidC [Afipia sp.]|uniref:membrane protein insertase YidC n=1 Tax=unclassified Afipia TaxID=2642050 RepID=UPI000463870A|nr:MULTISPECIES: membrane protein insertase YidC [unclassified Afipia]MAH71076.1 membrane protein insertase YidC [Afipia sp.]OUX59920.1 MAG: membrane protein insertase YidC [Afipia sp. TMED4]HAO42927.1 membrane protein insertase YidC [Afipia sp.]HAQ95021.1 membrane protein insertase YidC [Afipia sp.]HBF55443.1 membrane protein insertase YidC [Afipia sp.]
MIENRNTILAVILSGLVLIAWQYFYNIPTMEKQRAAQQAELAQKQAANPATPATTTPGANQPTPAAPGQQAGAPATAAPVQSRTTAIAAGPRVKIDTPSISGSIALTGGRIDDVALVKYRETVDPKSPAIELFSPSGTKEPFYAEFGFVPAAGATTKMPDKDTVWKQEGAGSLTPATPVTLTWNNGQGLTFKRTISIDDKYLFTIKDDVSNVGDAPVTLYPFGLISRHGTPHVSGYYILHEGLIGVLGDQGLQEYGYKKMDDTKAVEFKVTNAWMGITDKYWAATLLPSPKANVQARFSSNLVGTLRTYQTDYLLDPMTIAIGGTASTATSLFAGAKESATVDAYDKQLGLNKFDRLIDWGWFYFITKPMFWAIDWFFHIFGNFGVAILAVTVLVKLIFFPLANKSYASMAKMKAVQPQLAALKDKYPDDKMKQQQEMMEIYKKEKINPIAGCLPILIQIPVFFSLYKVLFVTIEMRHAPFFGWIKDLSAPDPTNLFNLFGLFAFDPTQLPVLGYYLHLGIWPIIMGITMWFQMKLNPTPPDPTQKMIFDWMPLIFTFMLAGFPAGLVIYWAWNNLLSVLQQSYIMKKNGAKIELFDNVKSTFAGSKKTT